MKRISLVVVGLYINLFHGFSQEKDSSGYRQRKLRLEEVNFVSSYYKQDGNNSAVTGGIGTEKLADVSNYFEVKLIRYKKNKKKVDLELGVGIDYYTSASSDNINPYSLSSASSRDLRLYPSLTRTVTNESKGSALFTNISYSVESDYQSYGLGAGLSRKSKDKNSEFTAKMQLYLDQLAIILPVELRTESTGGLYGAYNQHDYPWKHRNTISTAFTLSKIVNTRLHLEVLADLIYQEGFLGMPFHRIYFKDNSLGTEKLPSSRFKVPLAIKANYFFGDKIVIRSGYRFYKDDWGLNAHTADLETAYKITSFFSFTPFYRFYHQSAIDFFGETGQHGQTEQYYSSNYNLAKFSSHFFGAGMRLAPPSGLFGKTHWNMIEVKYGHYIRTNGLYANIISLHLKYK
ncbi:MAG: DUF3570 domain-containing protein [Ferruginibacter sp.]